MYSPSGHQIASGSLDGTVRLWNALTGASGPILTEHTGAVYSAMYSPTGNQLASGSEDQTVRVWDAQTGVAIAVLSGHSHIVSNVAFSPSGLQIASGSWDKAVRIWDVESGTCTSVLNGHTAEVLCVVYSSNGDRIASCSTDGKVRFWDVFSADCLASLHDVDVDVSVRWLAWRESDAGSYLATGNAENTVRMWRVTEEEGKPCLSLQWSSPHGSLSVKDANISNAHGLSRMQIQLLKQRGVVGDPIPPLSMRAAGGKLISMTDAVNRLSKAAKKTLLDGPAEELAGEAESQESWKSAQLAVEE